MELRTYQKNSILQLRDGFKTNKRQVLCLPTGAGKTVVFSEMVRLAFEKGTKTIVLTDRTELFKQTLRSLSNFGIAVEEIKPSKKNIYTEAKIFLAMVETVSRRKSILSQIYPTLIIIDEAHKGNFNKIIDIYPDARVIGATATPVGKHFFKYYTNIVQNIDVPELVGSGFLSPCRPYQMVDDFSDLETKRGEFTDFSLYAHFDKPVIYDGVIDQWKKYALGKKTIVFNVNIDHTEKTTQRFLKEGIPSECITSKTPAKERERILNAFSSGAFPVLNNCGILTTGYDEPSIECVVVNRATKSLPLWLQMCGRGSRVFTDKNEFILLDFGGNHDRHGLWNEPREWSLKPPKKKKDAVAPVKSCPKCEAMLHASIMTCNFCGYIFPKKEGENKDGKMVEVMPYVPLEFSGLRISELNIDDLIKLQRAKKYKPSFIWRVMRSRGEEALNIYAKKMGYTNGWVYRQTKDLHDSNFTDYKL